MPSPPAFAPQSPVAGCELCERPGGRLLWSDHDWRVIRADDAAFPAFYRVVCNRHVRELSMLSPAERGRCMGLVCAVEHVLVERLHPDKVNLAALGNVVPHLHWHVVARFRWDSHFPQPIWGTAQRAADAPSLAWLGNCLVELDEAVVEALQHA
jgi:diadenosine tetraphosphate (Ap4A) HIT family hydrolase